MRVGVGPTMQVPGHYLCTRWRVEPVVDFLNTQPGIEAEVFDKDSMLKGYDVVILVKFAHFMKPGIFDELRRAGTTLLFDCVCNPVESDENTARETGCRESFLKNSELMFAISGVIGCSPIHLADFKRYFPYVTFIDFPTLDFSPKTSYDDRETIVIHFDGWWPNVGFTDDIVSPVVRVLAKDLRREIVIEYHTHLKSLKFPESDDVVRFIQWDKKRWQDVLRNSDIGVAVKPGYDPVQRRKPSHKVRSYMAAGLPVVCTPSAADELVIESGKTGFLAWTAEDWYDRLRCLIESPVLRERIGIAGREFVRANYTMKQIGPRYVDFIRRVRGEA